MRSIGGARTAMKQSTVGLTYSTRIHQDAIPELFKLEVTSKGSQPPVSMIFTLKTALEK
jgi:hypothetical protein